jgi:hypothetical protein
MADVGGTSSNPISNVNLIFDDAASGAIPDQGPLVSGTYQPIRGTDHTGSCQTPASFPAPAPAGPYGSPSLSVFNGSDPNGTWKLYVIDDTRGDTGSITGWSLDISTTTVPTTPTTKSDCKKGGWKALGWPDQGTCITAVNQNRP